MQQAPGECGNEARRGRGCLSTFVGLLGRVVKGKAAGKGKVHALAFNETMSVLSGSSLEQLHM